MEKHVHSDLIKAWADGKEIEYQLSNGEWISVFNPTWDETFNYRVKTIKPSIDWSVLSDEFKWLAVDKDGCAYVYVDEPYYDELAWFNDEDDDNSSCYADVFCYVNCLKSYNRGNCDWKDSLVKRPD